MCQMAMSMACSTARAAIRRASSAASAASITSLSSASDPPAGPGSGAGGGTGRFRPAPALLVRALEAGGAVEGVEAVGAAQCDEPLVLPALTAQQHRDHRGLEVVVADHAGRHPAAAIERLHVPVQEGSLRPGWRRPTCTDYRRR